MSYRLKKEKNAGVNLRGIFCKQIRIALDIVQGEREVDDTPIHATRRYLKKARAALALLRDELGRGEHRQLDDCLRRVSQLTSSLRDAEVRWQTVNEFQPVRGKSGGFRELEKVMVLELGSFVAAFAGWQKQAAPLLEKVRDAAEEWKLSDDASRHLCAAVQRSYKLGRKMLAEAKVEQTPEKFHKLRSRTKELYYQLRILRPIDPEVLSSLTDELRVLGRMLGRAHDLSFLGERLRPERGLAEWQLEGQQVLALSQVTQCDLQRSATELAEHFYAERPRDFGSRIGSRLRQWEEESLTNRPGRGD
jgi:CHAD domain-containing protein